MQSQTFFSHFYCRELAAGYSVLHSDFSIVCAYTDASMYTVFTSFSVLGLMFVSIGGPVVSWLIMRKSLQNEMKNVKKGAKKHTVAIRDFGRKFEFIAGDYKTSAYFAENLDLIRKLVLSGMLVFVAPGTIIQSVCGIVVSYAFMLIHMRIWPYPHETTNWLKLFAEVQVFAVMVIGLVFRFPQDMLEAPFDYNFYTYVLGLLVASTAVAVVVKSTRPEKLQEAQRQLMHVATYDVIPLGLGVAGIAGAARLSSVRKKSPGKETGMHGRLQKMKSDAKLAMSEHQAKDKKTIMIENPMHERSSGYDEDEFDVVDEGPPEV